ncbi:hypothetical protein GCM10023238_32260 [Streptomyces heliomycini]
MGHSTLTVGRRGWLGVGAATAAAGHSMPWPVLLAGALICAGAALAPDLDHKAATISRAFGPVSGGLCEIVDKLSYAVYKPPRSMGDPRRSGGHRTLTHTGCGGPDRRRRRDPGDHGGGARWADCWPASSCPWCGHRGLLWRADARLQSANVLVWLLARTSA